MTAFTQIQYSLPVIPPRPKSLIRAAKAGQSGWRRGQHLAKLLRLEHCPRPAMTLPRLLTEEVKQNEARKLRAPSYDMQRHVLLMIAIFAEMAELSGQPVTCRETKIPKRP